MSGAERLATKCGMSCDMKRIHHNYTNIWRKKNHCLLPSGQKQGRIGTEMIGLAKQKSQETEKWEKNNKIQCFLMSFAIQTKHPWLGDIMSYVTSRIYAFSNGFITANL